MKKILYVPIVLSLVVLGAHFLRYGNMIGTAAAAALIALLFVRRPWAARVVQAALVLGALEWVRTLYMLAQMRAAMGDSAARMVTILGVVTAVTLGSALLFQVRALKAVYRIE